MQLITFERNQTTKLFWIVVAGLAVILLTTGKQEDPGITAAGLLLVIVAIVPFYLWLLGWSHGLPIWPVFALVNGVTSALPMIQDQANLEEYTAVEIITGSMTMVGFLLLATVIWLSMTAQTPKAPLRILMIEQAHSVRYLLLFVAIGILFSVNQVTNTITLPGNMMSVVRGIAMSLNTMGLFVLAFYMGRGMLNRTSKVAFIAGALVTSMITMTSLMLASALVPVAMIVFGYMLGSNKFPWKVCLLIFIAMGLLHPGKYEMRKAYWGEGSPPLTIATLPQFYIDWINFGLEEVGNVAGVFTGPKDEEGRQSGVFERAGTIHMLLLAQRKTPDEVPFFDGATYSPIPRLLIPRFLDDEKGISHVGNVMLSINYGLLTEEGARTTSIGWGLVPEAYANFGYLGVMGLAVVLAIFYAWMTRLTVGVPMTSLRFVLGLLVMAAATRADTMGVFVTYQWQGALGVSVAALFLMRRCRNPFVSLTGGEKRPVETGRREASPADFALFEQFAPAGDFPEPGASSKAAKGAPVHMPRWMSFAQRRAVLGSREAAPSADPAPASPAAPPRPRQLAVPFQNYRGRRRRR